jgi:hypothetical protein
VDFRIQRGPEIIVARVRERIEKCDTFEGALGNGTRYSTSGDDWPATQRVVGGVLGRLKIQVIGYSAVRDLLQQGCENGTVRSNLNLHRQYHF